LELKDSLKEEEEEEEEEEEGERRRKTLVGAERLAWH
jgi:hypothetical protein